MSASISALPRLTTCISRCRARISKTQNSRVLQHKWSNSQKSLWSSEAMAGGRQVSSIFNKLIDHKPRFIALYRPAHSPWTQYALSSQPDMAVECNERVIAAYQQGDFDSARMQFHRYRSLGVLPLPETWHKIILMAYKEGNYHDILSLFSTLRTADVSIDLTSWNFLLDVLSKRGLVRKTEEMYWNAFSENHGQLNAFAHLAVFKCCMQEQRYLRAMIACVGLNFFQIEADPSDMEVLKQWCSGAVGKLPGGIVPLNVPAVDRPALDEAIRLDLVTFGTSNLLRAAKQFSSEGKKIFQEWYNEKAHALPPDQAFDFILDRVTSIWETRAIEALGYDSLQYVILKGLTQPGEVGVDPHIAQQLEERMNNNGGIFFLSDYPINDSGRVVILVKNLDGYSRHVIDENGSALPEAEAEQAVQMLAKSNPLELLKSGSL